MLTLRVLVVAPGTLHFQSVVRNPLLETILSQKIVLFLSSVNDWIDKSKRQVYLHKFGSCFTPEDHTHPLTTPHPPPNTHLNYRLVWYSCYIIASIPAASTYLFVHLRDSEPSTMNLGEYTRFVRGFTQEGDSRNWYGRIKLGKNCWL